MTIRRTANRAFTLIEVLLVILIIGILATVLVTQIGGQGEGAKVDLTKVNLKRVAVKLDEFKLAIGRYPTTDEGLDALVEQPQFDDEATSKKWRGPYLSREQLKDGWGKDLNYESVEATGDTTASFKLFSSGSDGQENSDDDLQHDGSEEEDQQ